MTCVCRDPVLAIIRPHTARRRRWSKPAHWGRYLPSRRLAVQGAAAEGATCRSGLFGEGTRYPYQPVGSCVRALAAGKARDVRATTTPVAVEQPRPRTHRVRKLTVSVNLPCPQTHRVRELTVSANSPCPPTHRVRQLTVSAHWPQSRRGPRAVRVRIAETPRRVCGQATVADASSPWTVRTFGDSTTRPWPRIVRVHKRALASVSPCPETRSVRQRAAGGPAQTQPNRAYVLV